MLTSPLSVSLLPGGDGPCLVRSAVRSLGCQRSSQPLRSGAVGHIACKGTDGNVSFSLHEKRFPPLNKFIY